MADFRERRYLNDRRQPDRADDLHKRLEEKRQQLERRKNVRRRADRDRSVHDDRSEAADTQPPSNGTGDERQAGD
jgi:hypothetical protein